MLSGIVKLCFSYSVRLLWRCRCQCRYHSIPFHAMPFLIHALVFYPLFICLASYIRMHARPKLKIMIETSDESAREETTPITFSLISSSEDFCWFHFVNQIIPFLITVTHTRARAAHTHTMYSTYTHWQIRNGGTHFYLHSISAIQTVCTDFMHSQTILLKSPEWNSTMANTPRMCANQ